MAKKKNALHKRFGSSTIHKKGGVAGQAKPMQGNSGPPNMKGS